MLSGHIDPTFLHIHIKTQPISKSIFMCYCQVCARTNMSIKLGIYDIYEKFYVHICNIYNVSGIDHTTKSTAHIFQITLNMTATLQI